MPTLQMKDKRIKELLIQLTDYDSNVWLDNNECKELIDYITNLQEENEIKDTNWESLKYYLEKLYYKDYIEEAISDDIDKKIKELESKVEIKGYQKDIKALQKENEELKEALQQEKKDFKEANDYCFELKDYKSRIEKAIKYIEKSINNPQPFYKYLFGDENGKVENLDRLLNILQGVGKDE